MGIIIFIGMVTECKERYLIDNRGGEFHLISFSLTFHYYNFLNFLN